MEVGDNMPIRPAVLVVTTLLTVVGCSGSGAAPDAPPSAVSETSGSDAQGSTVTSGSSPAAVRVVKENQADLHLWVSNQSFKDDPVVLNVSIDGAEVIAQPFEVEGQHNWILFPLQVPPGRHILSVISETGVRMRKHFTLPESGPRYAVVDYWNYSDAAGRHITWHIQSDPMGFA
jgi:hypothetical protein